MVHGPLKFMSHFQNAGIAPSVFANLEFLVTAVNAFPQSVHVYKDSRAVPSHGTNSFNIKPSTTTNMFCKVNRSSHQRLWILMCCVCFTDHHRSGDSGIHPRLGANGLCLFLRWKRRVRCSCCPAAET